MNCPMCGASASTESSKCSHCGARLATIACPACFGMMFLGAKFCSHCGAAASRQEEEPSGLKCPRCHEPLRQTLIGDASMQECPKCEGLWVDTETLHRIQCDRERQAAVLGAGRSPLQPGSVLESKVRYIRCPVCGDFMNRFNFARCSGVIVDVCKPHGTWLDRDELRHVVEFIRSGGLELARSRQIAELDYQRRRLAAEKADAANDVWRYGRDSNPRGRAVSVVIDLVTELLD